LIVLGGLYEHEYDHFAGAHVQTILRDLRVDTLYMGVDGVTIDGGLMTHDILESGLHEMMASIAQRVVVVVDSSKIGVTKLQRTLPLDRVNTFITDAGAPTEFLEALRKMGAEVIVAPLE
jgi:DeoR family transcriptional regulator of aga operon